MQISRAIGGSRITETRGKSIRRGLMDSEGILGDVGFEAIGIADQEGVNGKMLGQFSGRVRCHIWRACLQQRNL